LGNKFIFYVDHMALIYSRLTNDMFQGE
jgi:hypothetical protein